MVRYAVRRASFVASQGIYGAPRVFLDLREAGETCSKHRVARADARESAASAPRLSHAAVVGREARRADSQPAAAPIHGAPTESGLGHGHHVCADVARVALPRRRHGSLLAQDRRLDRDRYGVFTARRTGMARGDCVRITPALFNSPADVDRLAAAITELSRA
jgi:hypothetical protein